MTVAEDASAAPPLRDRIIKAAFTAFMERGYAGVSTLDIARAARVSKRDLYAEFGSKQAMLAACIAERATRMRVALNLAAPGSREALAETLVAFGKTLLLEVSRPEVLAVYRLALLEAERSPEVARTLDQLGRQDSHAALAALLAGAQAAGLLPPAKPPLLLTESFVALLWRGGLMMRLLLGVAEPPDAAELEDRARFATQVVLSGAL